MAKLTRRGFLGTAAAAGALRGVGVNVAKPQMRRVLTLAYDKSLGMMRAVEKLVPM
ncbi:MAG: twin-arginine translocation signal domain-containing protein [Sulfitobacter sp.]